jgi:hypothetical protein
MNRAFVLISAAALLPAASAQDSQPPAVISVIREAVKEGRSAAHEKVETDYARAFRKANFPYHYLALAAMSGPGEVWFLTAFPSFEAMEKSEKEMEKGALKGEIEMLDARDGELRSSSRTMQAVYRKDLSYRPDTVNVGKSRYVMISAYRVRLGQMEGFMNGAKSILGAYEKADFKEPMVTYQVIAGAPEGLFLFLSPMESLKMLDQMPERQKAMREALGAERLSALMKGAGEVFTSMESTLFAVSPKMSYVSKETEDVDPAFWRPKPPAKATGEAKPKEKPGL